MYVLSGIVYASICLVRNVTSGMRWMGMSKPTLVSLFTGGGGLDIGLEQAGFRTLAAVECDPDCVETLKLNQSLPHPIADGGCILSEARIIPLPIEEVGKRRRTGFQTC
jgi:site-specific DNA-cytosine methylase